MSVILYTRSQNERKVIQPERADVVGVLRHLHHEPYADMYGGVVRLMHIHIGDRIKVDAVIAYADQTLVFFGHKADLDNVIFSEVFGKAVIDDII